MVLADYSPTTLRRISPETTRNNLELARDLIPQVASVLSPTPESIGASEEGLQHFFGEWEASIRDLLTSRLAQRNFHISTPQPDQESLHDNLELATLHMGRLFEAILDPTGTKAREYRPTREQFDRVVGLVNPKLPEDAPAIHPIGQAFERYAPKHPSDFMVLAPTILLETLGAAEYQNHRAPYAGHVNQLTRLFYDHYNRTVPPELATTNPKDYLAQTQAETFDRMVYFRDFNIGYFGIGNGNEELIREFIRGYREASNTTRLLSRANKPIEHVGFDILDPTHVAPWLDQYYQLSLEQIYLHPELRGQVGQLFSFGSVFMDILEVVKYLQSLLGASHVLTRGGRFCDDQALPVTYQQEIASFHALHAEEPVGMFRRDWRTGEADPPAKYFYAMPLVMRYFFYHLAGLKPESFGYSDAMHLEALLQQKPDLLAGPLPNRYRRPWLHQARETAYQTVDAHGHIYHRANITLRKKPRTKLPPILPLFTNFLARSPAFAPKPEQ